jgi:chromosomal replication initiator protein
LSQDLAIWDDILSHVRQEIPDVEFRTWFQQVKPLGVTDGTYLIGVPHSFARDWLKNHYSTIVESALTSLGASAPKVGFQVVDFPSGEQPDLFDAGEDEPAVQAIPQPSATKVALNPKYVFSKFVVGPHNNLAHAAAMAVAEAPGRAYNPLFLYADAGLGKTHLMHAVGHAAPASRAGLQIEYVTTEVFTNDLISAIREDRMTAFRDRYRSIDVLLVDDIQFLAGKERTQEEFFHTFNALYESGKQIIVSSDRPPKDIPTLENRLRSRFEWGLITDMQPPEFETRLAILRMNADYRGVKVPDDVIEYIAMHATSNIRELEGALVRVIVFGSMNNAPLSREVAAAALSDVFAPSDAPVVMKDVLTATAAEFSVTADALTSKGRRKELVEPRQVAMYLIRELTSHSLPEIGAFFGGRDHTTVMYAVRKVSERTERDPEFASRVAGLRSKFA